jgi:signal transduction histidine kinase
MIWVYGAYVLLARPYAKYPVFLASWFTYVSDSVFTTLWLFATGGADSPFFVIYYTSVIAVAFRFNLRITMFTSALYVLCYFGLVWFLGQLDDHTVTIFIRCGFIFIIGFLTNYITQETLLQTKEKLQLKELKEAAEENNRQMQSSREVLAKMNETLQLRNSIFQHAEENSKLGSFSWNLGKQKLEYSDNFFRLLEAEPGSFEPTFDHFLTYVHPDDRESVKMSREAIAETKTVPDVVRKMITAKNNLKFFRMTGKFVTMGQEQLIIGTAQDVTEDVMLAEEINLKNQELERSNNELSSFNYIASHDLQEPVRKITTFSNMIFQKDGEKLTETTKDYLNRINGSAARMQRLIEAFSSYSRIGSKSLKKESVDLVQMIKDARSNLGELVEETKTEIHADNMPVIEAVPFHMQQLFENLIGNSIKYRKKDQRPVITITTKKIKGYELSTVQRHSDYWEIRLKDNGIGFDPQYSEKIFDVFQRLHTKDQYPGTGIGLAICKKIVLSHQGFIHANSKPGEGAEFVIHLPA